ncbi:5-formyltetrahydrofolate cyclo-ligase [Sphingomonas sp. BN140010]|uniref:5-formyltetrahydrofolate cyclo-ligase n=1 Tax=Sphingomonas arvum TaxID=2992113 RepID=A0ABT3JE08_9SPHN|nr:5-formyltetrahydrofolate cyclo-ligase [Sphingomonas sp. BN140010]MCW3797304.1 5-formyltetrahydrofolate cyclo-ligase [Sphingomonas sp. BN140010]
MAVPSPPVLDKGALRDAMRRRRRDYAASLTPETRKRLEAQLAEALDPLLFACTRVAAYFPMKDEVSCLPALERARAMGKTTALPFFADRDSRMTFRAGEPVDPGPWGILQPDAAAAIVSPDLLLIPLIVIDISGNRIGMGKGHYDRTLPGLRGAGARLVGVGWPFQLVTEQLAPDPWDVPLDGFASPDGLQEFAR